MTHEKQEKVSVEGARQLLADLGMDSERCNERSAMTLMALCQLRHGDAWSNATNEMLGTRAIMDWIRDNYGMDYAPNTRETIRRFTLHQFVLGALAEQNADDPARPMNSPKWNYRLTAGTLEVIRSYGTPGYEGKLRLFLANVGTYLDATRQARNMELISVTLPAAEGAAEKSISLGPGGQNLLMKEMIEEFCPRFAPGGRVLYIDDASKKVGVEDAGTMALLGIELPERGKAPDLIVWLADNNWLFLMEACSSHGPVDVTRKLELTEMFENCAGKHIFVSCFPSRAVMRGYLSELAWETEAWCADTPDHMIHLDGKRFLGPYD